MNNYLERSVAIHGLARDLRRSLAYVALRGTVADKIVMIDLTVETINKLLYSFAISAPLLDAIDRLLNEPYRALKPHPRAVNRLFYRCCAIARSFERITAAWQASYQPT